MTPIALLDFADPRNPHGARLRHAFTRAPRQTWVAHTWSDVCPVLDAVEAAARAGAWCVGGLRYEAAGAFDTAFETHAPQGPLAWFAAFDAPEPWPANDPPLTEAPVVDWHTEPERAAFDAAMESIHAAIAAGEYYQVNYTAALHGTVQAAPGTGRDATARALFAALQRAQPGGYAACIDMGAEQALSVSPELFFDWRTDAAGGSLLARPMKGTAPRGATPQEDAERAATLRTSPKERAENVMIVDLLRNDLSRIAEPHSVRVPVLFHTEPLPAVWQMTSDVQATTRAGTTLAGVFGALFPCGSITGAPKVRAMQAIHALEPEPRGWYCGALGVVRPHGAGGIAATFNVPIRTVVLHGGAGGGPLQARCGIGSGITYSAQPDAEWDEWHHKRAFVERASVPFDVLETLALEAGRLRHRSEHLARMAASAAHFQYPWQSTRIDDCLDALIQAHPQGLWRVRLLLQADGTPRAKAFAMQPTTGPVRLALAGRPLHGAHSEFVRHKTTRRAHYTAFEPAPDSGVFDTLLWNAAGEITECTRGNVAMQLADGRWVTPPLTCGLLPGIGRAVALAQGRVTEAVVRKDDVAQVQAWAFMNSLRGWLPATLRP